MDIIFWDVLILYQVSFKPQEKRSVIISNKRGIYELPHEFPNDLGLSNLEIRKYKENLKTSLNYSLVPSVNTKMKFCQYYQKTAEKWKLNFSRSALFHKNSRVCLKYLVHDCLCKQMFPSNSTQVPLNLICLTILVTLRSLTEF